MATSTTPTSLTKLLQEKREDILHNTDQHGAFNMRIFGSVSLGESRPGSDVGFLPDDLPPFEQQINAMIQSVTPT